MPWLPTPMMATLIRLFAPGRPSAPRTEAGITFGNATAAMAAAERRANSRRVRIVFFITSLAMRFAYSNGLGSETKFAARLTFGAALLPPTHAQRTFHPIGSFV